LREKNFVVDVFLADRRLKKRPLFFPLALLFLSPLSELCCPNRNTVSSRGREEAIAETSMSSGRKMRTLFLLVATPTTPTTRRQEKRAVVLSMAFDLLLLLFSHLSLSLSEPFNRTNSNPGAHMTTLHAAAPSRVSCWCGDERLGREKEGENETKGERKKALALSIDLDLHFASASTFSLLPFSLLLSLLFFSFSLLFFLHSPPSKPFPDRK